MLEKQKDIDAVIVATPDHNHAVVAMAAMQMGKHVYVQKPLTRTVYEARALTNAARKYNVATQMGNQGHSSDTVRILAEWIWDGAIGDIRQVHAWTDRPIWPQGLYRPSEKPDIPDTLAWDLWLGPSPNRPYHPAYLPWVWRGWWDFGTGAIGDMACHVLDVVFFALKLGAPDSVEASSPRIFMTRDLVKESMGESAPIASIIHSHFPARQNMPPVDLTWYDGGLKPSTPPELEKERKLSDNGILFIGDKGTILSGTYGEGARIIPETKMKNYKLPPKTLPRIKVSHEENWMQACKSGEKPSSHFEYSGPMTEAVLLGNVALRMGKKLEWDAKKMQITNLREANALINPPHRAGWAL